MMFKPDGATLNYRSVLFATQTENPVLDNMKLSSLYRSEL